jgi:hypothetical protein
VQHWGLSRNGEKTLDSAIQINANGKIASLNPLSLDGKIREYKTRVMRSTYTIGQAALGGKIAYILQPGDPGYDPDVQHGLVATVADISRAAWGCEGINIPGAAGTAIGTGNQNTIDIMAGCATAGIAARLAGDLVQGGYSDWYLPSKDELNKLYLNKTAIGGFQSGIYWSSTEFPNYYAWDQTFFDGFQSYFDTRDFQFYVRAIRSF